MTSTPAIVAGLALLSVTTGALAWSLGWDKSGQRSVVFGILLAAFWHLMFAGGVAVMAWLRSNGEVLALGLVAVVLGLAIVRWASSSGCHHDEKRLTRKKRVGH